MRRAGKGIGRKIIGLAAAGFALSPFESVIFKSETTESGQHNFVAIDDSGNARVIIAHRRWEELP